MPALRYIQVPSVQNRNLARSLHCVVNDLLLRLPRERERKVSPRRTTTTPILVMGQTCSTPGEKEAREEEEEEEEEKVLEDDDDFGYGSKRCRSPLDVGKDFLRFEKSSVEEEERRGGRARGTKEVREERAPFFYREGREEDARRDEARVVGKVVSVILSEEEKKSSPRYRWAVGDKELREAMTNGENTVKSTMFTAKKHEFRLSLGNSVVVEGGPAKTFVSAKLECCAPSSSKLSHASNFVDIAATMRVSLEFSGDARLATTITRGPSYCARRTRDRC